MFEVLLEKLIYFFMLARTSVPALHLPPACLSSPILYGMMETSSNRVTAAVLRISSVDSDRLDRPS
jgi:hypothetical protein